MKEILKIKIKNSIRAFGTVLSLFSFPSYSELVHCLTKLVEKLFSAFPRFAETAVASQKSEIRCQHSATLPPWICLSNNLPNALEPWDRKPLFPGKIFRKLWHLILHAQFQGIFPKCKLIKAALIKQSNNLVKVHLHWNSHQSSSGSFFPKVNSPRGSPINSPFER